MIKIGLIGYSKCNGHPYSFGSIINGFFPGNFEPEWSLIKDYLSIKPKTDFLSLSCKIVSVWTPSLARSQSIQKSCHIEKVYSSYHEMKDIDAVIIARDDWLERNLILDYFLSKGIPCFCDKPLTASLSQLYSYEKYIHKGLLYTGSGMRYAYELDSLRSKIKSSLYISCHIANDLEKYGIHMLDALFSAKSCDTVASRKLEGEPFPIYQLYLADGSIFRMTCSPHLSKTFLFSYLTEDGDISYVSIKDNFTGFRRLLASFLEMVSTGVNPDSEISIRSVKALCMLAQASCH